ncbi:DUF1330 domain-containing protein [Gammaproteobacteria bacterium]|nr:DUF1330 domain-containing protein [Gammaproteobacteria bacterium]MDA8924530.1 DUF1330 domain-containing protein [Gammaproteobacteria bacterium]MDA9154045.1 DUF1330 domain-containing protein [Gammaproteobacteria bacterium]MDB9790842.1 DUF1330 domain-containing protein [Gammaproteobacteria bacterium]
MSDFEIIAIANLEITDADEYRKYEKGFFPILKKYNGSFITYDDAPEHKEGDIPLKGRVILFGFLTQEDASNWFHDPEYQELSKFRRDGTSTHSITFTKMLKR